MVRDLVLGSHDPPFTVGFSRSGGGLDSRALVAGGVTSHEDHQPAMRPPATMRLRSHLSRSGIAGGLIAAIRRQGPRTEPEPRWRVPPGLAQ